MDLCGNIYVTKDTKSFLLKCIFCDKSVESMLDFIYHVQNYHNPLNECYIDPLIGDSNEILVDEIKQELETKIDEEVDIERHEAMNINISEADEDSKSSSDHNEEDNGMSGGNLNNIEMSERDTREERLVTYKDLLQFKKEMIQEIHVHHMETKYAQGTQLEDESLIERLQDDDDVRCVPTTTNILMPKATSKCKSISFETRKKEIAKKLLKFPCLWSKSDAGYRSHQKREVAWSNVANAMDLTVSEAKLLWKKVKDTQYLPKKQQKTKSGNLAQEYSDDDNEDMQRQGLRHEMALLERQTSLSTCSDDISCEQPTSSVYTYTNPKRKRNESQISIEANNVVIESTSALIAKQDELKYFYNWLHLEKLYEQLDDATIVDFHFKFISQVLNVIFKKRLYTK